MVLQIALHAIRIGIAFYMAFWSCCAFALMCYPAILHILSFLFSYSLFLLSCFFPPSCFLPSSAHVYCHPPQDAHSILSAKSTPTLTFSLALVLSPLVIAQRHQHQRDIGIYIQVRARGNNTKGETVRSSVIDSGRRRKRNRLINQTQSSLGVCPCSLRVLFPLRCVLSGLVLVSFCLCVQMVFDVNRGVFVTG